MVKQRAIGLWAVALVILSLPATAQYVTTSPPQETATPPGAASSGGLEISPKKGQSNQQQWTDRYECHRWATTQSGFDPTRPAAEAQTAQNANGRDQYRRAMTACLQGRGYEVSDKAVAAVAPPPSPASSLHPVAPQAESGWHPVSVRIEGGYTIAAGATDRYLEDGYNVGFGLTFFPSPAIPLGLRVDGSYSSFRGRNALLDLYPGGFTFARRNIYGGDADLQFNLSPPSSRSLVYLFGGAGWYRDQTHLRQVTFEEGIFCGYYFCGPGFGPVLTAAERVTSPWHSAWNAGLGWELSNPGGPSLFVEARYLSIAPRSSQMQFVPIRVGLRF